MKEQRPNQAPSVTLVRRLKASPAKVYAAWTRPEQIVCWWGSAGADLQRAEVDVRVGGAYRIGFRTPDGEDNEASGVYREVEPDRRLVFTWAWRTTQERQSLVTVDIQPVDGGAELTFTHAQLFDETTAESHRLGWAGAFDKLEAFVDPT
jgi:uncharacterized protein YndB with AHSA1/START domain